MDKIYGISKVLPERKEVTPPVMDFSLMGGPGGPGGPEGPGAMPFGAGGPPPAGFLSAPAYAKAALYIRNGQVDDELSCREYMYAGDLSGRRLEHGKIVTYGGLNGGICVHGAGALDIDDTVIHINGGDNGYLGGPDSGLSVVDHADVTLKNSIIDTNGRCRSATIAEGYSTLRVYDSVLISHGIPYGEGIEKPAGFMATPPASLEISGNTRTHCTLSNSRSFFYNSTIIADGWAALSTDGAEGYVYLEANDCNVVTTKGGYGAYSDGECHDRFVRCSFDVADMAAIIASSSDMTFIDCDSKCGTYFALMHSIGLPDMLNELTVSGGTIKSGKEILRMKSCCANVDLTDVSMEPGNGILFRTMVNDDEKAPKDPGREVFGYQIRLHDIDAQGDILHEDSFREMWLTLRGSTIRGAILNANLTMDTGSKWYATGDSTVTLLGEVNCVQIDAADGVTIHAVGNEPGEYTLSSGGKLIVSTQKNP